MTEKEGTTWWPWQRKARCRIRARKVRIKVRKVRFIKGYNGVTRRMQKPQRRLRMSSLLRKLLSMGGAADQQKIISQCPLQHDHDHDHDGRHEPAAA